MAAMLLVGCMTLGKAVPEGFVPDSEVVYLRQAVAFEPIFYETEWADPYDWDVELEPNRDTPIFFDPEFGFDDVLAPGHAADLRLYADAKAHLLIASDNPDFQEGRSILDEYVFREPRRLVIESGNEIKKYTNATRYDYPPVLGAQIVLYHDGTVRIDLPDGDVYRDNGEYYFMEDRNGQEKYSVFPGDGAFRITENGNTFKTWAGGRSVEGPFGKVAFMEGPMPQYQFHSEASGLSYTFFLEDDRIGTRAVHLPSGLRIDFKSDENQIEVLAGEENLVIQPDFGKTHVLMNLDVIPWEQAETLSVYMPEGLRITGFDGPVVSSVLDPAWPEDYCQADYAGFQLLYTEKDAALLDRLDETKFRATADHVASLFGAQAVDGAVFVIPPDLESYRKLHAGRERERLNWYPSGFQGLDRIVLWPLSVPVYATEEGVAHFWNEELSDTIVHELTHLAIGRVTGVFNPFPVWLNEGAALYIEASVSSAQEDYWKTTYAGYRSLRRFLPWDDIAVRSTSYYPIEQARLHYAQSYAMVRYMVEAYGMKHLIDFIRSFHRAFDADEEVDLTETYRNNFEEIYGMAWDEHLKGFDAFYDEESAS